MNKPGTIVRVGRGLLCSLSGVREILSYYRNWRHAVGFLENEPSGRLRIDDAIDRAFRENRQPPAPARRLL